MGKNEFKSIINHSTLIHKLIKGDIYGLIISYENIKKSLIKGRA